MQPDGFHKLPQRDLVQPAAGGAQLLDDLVPDGPDLVRLEDLDYLRNGRAGGPELPGEDAACVGNQDAGPVVWQLGGDDYRAAEGGKTRPGETALPQPGCLGHSRRRCRHLFAPQLGCAIGASPKEQRCDAPFLIRAAAKLTSDMRTRGTPSR